MQTSIKCFRFCEKSGIAWNKSSISRKTLGPSCHISNTTVFPFAKSHTIPSFVHCIDSKSLMTQNGRSRISKEWYNDNFRFNLSPRSCKNLVPKRHMTTRKRIPLKSGGGKTQIAVQSPAIIVDKQNLIKNPILKFPFPLIYRVFTPAGVKAVWNRGRHHLTNYYGWKSMQRDLKALKIPTKYRPLKKELQGIYLNACEQLAKRDLSELKKYVTTPYWEAIKSHLQHVPFPKKARVEWKGTVSKQKLVGIRYIPIAKMSNKLTFGQLTFKFETSQIFSVYDEKGVLVAGSETPRVVIETCTFERNLKDKFGSWLFCGKLGPQEVQGS